VFDNIGQMFDNIGQVFFISGQVLDNIGQVFDNIGQMFSNIGQMIDNIGQVLSFRVQPIEITGIRHRSPALGTSNQAELTRFLVLELDVHLHRASRFARALGHSLARIE
jgi:hypothetical protein